MDERVARLEGRWREEAEAIATGLTAWRAQHPRATFGEIEAALDARLDGMRARLLEDLALASRATDGGGEGAVCRECGGRLEGHGAHARQVVTQGDRVVRLRRAYARCSARGAGLFPPG